jgi:fatty acid desaturase
MVQIAASVALGHYLLSIQASVWTVVILALLAIFIATRLRGLNNIVHECSHATFSQHYGDNTIIGSLSASMSLGCFRDYREEHMTHHANVGDYENDLDLQAIRALKIDEPLSGSVVIRHMITPLLGRHLPYYLRANFSARDGRVYQAMKVALVAGSVVLALVAPLTAVLFLWVPYVFLYSTINYWTDCLDHAGISMAGDDLDSSRNVLAPWLVRLLFFPRNDSFHLVHHLFPQVPARHLPRTHAVLSEDLVYRSKANAVRAPEGALAHHPEAKAESQT